MSSKTEAASQVRQVLQAVKDRLGQPGGSKVNEATTRAHFLNPLLEALGYASIDDILFEVYLPDGKTFLDYRLVVDGRPRVSVEAKALDVPVTDAHAAQAVSYATVLGDEWAIVTNAREWRLYHTFAQTALAEKLVLKVDLVGWETDAQFDAVFEQLWLVSKESFRSGEGPAGWMTTRKLDQLLRSALTDESSPEVRYIRRQLEARGISVTTGQIAGWVKARLDSATTPAPAPGGPYPKIVSAGTHARIGSGVGAFESAAAKRAVPSNTGYWLIPAGKQHGYSAAEHLRRWLDNGFWGFGPSTPGRRHIKAGDWACFYAAESHEVLAYGRISGPIDQPVLPNEWPGPDMWHDNLFKVPLDGVDWLAKPVVIDSVLRARLDAFQNKDPSKGWSWLVQTTRRLSQADFRRLTGQ